MDEVRIQEEVVVGEGGGLALVRVHLLLEEGVAGPVLLHLRLVVLVPVQVLHDDGRPHLDPRVLPSSIHWLDWMDGERHKSKESWGKVSPWYLWRHKEEGGTYGNLSRQLDAGSDHVQALPMRSLRVEDVSQQDQGTGGQPVQVLRVGDL